MSMNKESQSVSIKKGNTWDTFFLNRGSLIVEYPN